ncbi:hypothetical protein HHK36_004670 [Tetracentron sinense]|uniref:PGG domain-containing protein n=1 Tax=Tetracentron sinense TaxID=13715 RepID=A0A834ZU40_TETSI|nr:hypothetical protein HHK36_004670 [Tetracentron sinense]
MLSHPTSVWCKWKAPPVDHWGINTDGSVRTTMAGIGCVIRNHLGDPLVGVAGGIDPGPILVVELLAIQRGLAEAVSRGLRKVVVYLDSKGAVDAINNCVEWPWEAYQCLLRISGLMRLFDSVTVHHVFQETNRAADFLSSFCHLIEEVVLDPREFPSMLSRFIADDAGVITHLEQTPSIRSCFPERSSDKSSETCLDLSPIPSPDLRIPIPEDLVYYESPTLEPTIREFLSVLRFMAFFPWIDIIAGTKTTIAPSLTVYVPLYRAALRGDWEMAQEFLNCHPGAVHAKITRGWETALHIAAGARHTLFVEELVKLMKTEDLALKNKYKNTALCFAAASGIVRIAEVMVRKNKHLPIIRGSSGVIPLYMAALLGHRDMVHYLYSVTRDENLTTDDRIGLLVATITTNLYDVALQILDHHPELATVRDGNGETALHVLARKPWAFASGNQLTFWETSIYQCIHVKLSNESKFHFKSPTYQTNMITKGFRIVYEKKLLHIQAHELVKRLWQQVLQLDDSLIGDILREPSRPLFTATEFGIVEFVSELIRSYPDLIWKVDNQHRSIFHTAVAHRQQKIFNLIFEIGALKDLITSYKDDNNNNMLHLAGKIAPSNQLNSVSGAALQMQRELLWFKEVEKIVQPLYREMRNSEGRTPRMLFTEEHKGLVKEGEKWMKNTATSCMLVATLITTVMFAAIFTVPGGNIEKEGIPILLQNYYFIIFAMSDALALFSSVTSILNFLSILTSCYAEEDFLESLPKRLIIGLGTLFFSIVNMLIAFGATFFIVLGHQSTWILIPVILITCIPPTLFVILQFPLLADMINSTYGSGILNRTSKHMLF